MTSANEHPGADIREYLRVVRDRKYEIALVTLVLVAAALIFSSRQTPIYEGETKVLVKPVQAPGTGTIPQAPNLDTERELVLSQPVAQSVKDSLALATPVDELLKNTRVEVVLDTEVLLIRYRDPDPAVAARVAGGFANAYVQFRTDQAIAQYEAAAATVQQRIDGVERSLSDLAQRIRAAQDPEVIDGLEAQRSILLAQLGVLQQRLLDLQASSSTTQTAAQVIQPAEPPDSPSSPDLLRNGILALLAGLALGVGFVFLRERLDDRVKSRQEIERRLGVPVLAAVPRVSGWRKPEEPQLVMRADPKSPVSEAYRTLGTNILYMASRDSLKVLMITSSTGDEGKTTTAANLAVVLAQTGKRVVLLSADLRRPRVHRFFDLPNHRGLSSVLSDSLTPSDAVKDPGVANLRILPSGPVPNNPAELLGGAGLADLLGSLREAAEFIVIDTPPVLAVADASILAPLADGTIFVMDADHSSRSALTQSRDQLENAGARIIGAVYNNFDPNRGAAYPYYYYNYYYSRYGGAEERSNGPGTPPRGRLRRRARQRLVRRGGRRVGNGPDGPGTLDPGPSLSPSHPPEPWAASKPARGPRLGG